MNKTLGAWRCLEKCNKTAEKKKEQKKKWIIDLIYKPIMMITFTVCRAKPFFLPYIRLWVAFEFEAGYGRYVLKE